RGTGKVASQARQPRDRRLGRRPALRSARGHRPMSRAFVKEDGPDTEPLPDLPVSPHPNYVTPRGLKALRDRLVALQADLARLKARTDRLDLLPEKAAERDIRYVEARLRTAIL